MAETPKAEAKPEEAASGGGESKLPLILVLLNTIAILAALGAFVYTRILFKRPAITEQAERERLAMEVSKPKVATESGLIHFDPVTINIKPTAANPAPDSAPGPGQFPGQMHYAQIAFSFEVSDISRKEEIETLRPIILDRVLSMIGRKTFEELATVQGRYLLRTQMMDAVNELLKIQSVSGDAAVTNVYFNQFQVQ